MNYDDDDLGKVEDDELLDLNDLYDFFQIKLT